VTLGLAIFAATYNLVAVQRLPFLRLNRPAASLLGLMLIVGYLEVGRFFPERLLLGVVVGGGLLSP